MSILVAACGPSGRNNTGGDDTTDVDAPVTGNFATITGKVWAPNQGPGQAMLGQEIPISGALVYVTTNKPAPIPTGVYCEQCVPTPSGGVLTGADGSFTIDKVPAGKYTVEYWHEKLGKQTVDVEVKAGKPAALNLEMAVK